MNKIEIQFIYYQRMASDLPFIRIQYEHRFYEGQRATL